jgi:murein DD-endopeptidase MepM/ murein hydrolase activator NlpD
MRARHRSVLATSGLIASALVSACVEIKDADPKPPQADSAAGVVVGVPAIPPTTPGTAAFGPDSATRIRGGPLSTPEALAALQTDTMSSLGSMDSIGMVAPLPVPPPGARSTPAAAGGTARGATPATAPLGNASIGPLAVPVLGVPVSDLRDTYAEKRGGGTRTHEALDIAAPRGTPVLSATGGRVLKLFDSKAGGLMVYATDSSERFILLYGHLDGYANGLAEGQPLRRGQTIGRVGTTGNAPPNLPHLHFAVGRSADVKQWWKGEPVNPYPLLTAP